MEKQLVSHFEVTFLKPRLTIETVDLAHGYDAMCCFVNDDLSADVIERLSEKCGVKMIALRCAGFDKVDVESCKKFGVLVHRVPMYDPLSIAEHAMALILALNRKLMISHSRVKSGNFTLDGLVGFSMRGKTLGVVGTGKIGRGLANICANGFSMSVLGYDLKQKREFVGQYCDDVETVLKNSDIISLHLPLNEHTKHFIAEKAIDSMKRGAMLINTSRGGILNIKDVICGLRLGKLGSYDRYRRLRIRGEDFLQRLFQLDRRRKNVVLGRYYGAALVFASSVSDAASIVFNARSADGDC